MSGARYVELQCTSHFSFLRGASSCDELFAQAATLGIEALAVVDRNSLAGIVRAHEAAKTSGVRLIVGCRLDLADGQSVLVYPMDRPAYARLCRLLSLGKKRSGKAKCHLDWADLVAYGEGLIAILVPDEADETSAIRLRRLRASFGDRAYMALALRRRPNDQLRIHELSNMAMQARVPTVVTNDVLFHVPGRRILQDVVTSYGQKIETAGKTGPTPASPRRVPATDVYGVLLPSRDGVSSRGSPRTNILTIRVLSRPRYGRREKPEEGGDVSVGVAGHRHGSRVRTVMGTFGKTEIAVPRARLNGSDGKTTEWKSQALRSYQRRTLAADALIASTYLSGTNIRRVRRALRALFGGAVGKDVVSRVWRKVKSDWEAWNPRSLADEPIVRLILDGTVMRVRLDRKATSISLLVIIGVRRCAWLASARLYRTIVGGRTAPRSASSRSR
jgi:hypothetical protein